jgi:hypothetical protein
LIVTFGRAKAVLSYLWITAFVILCAIISLQTLFGKFGSGDDWDTGFGWFFSLTIPSLSLMLTVWGLQQTAEDKKEVTSSHVLWAAIAFSAFYLACMLALLLLHPFAELPLQTQLRHSAWYLAILQGIVTALLGRLFIVNAG